MLNSKNYISYLAKGEKTFLCPFNSIIEEEEIEVLIEGNKQKLNIDYYLQGVNDNQINDNIVVVFFESIGDLDNHLRIIIRKKPLIIRKTNINNISEVRSENLNLEFNNIISNQEFFKDTLNVSVKNYLNDKEIILPSSEAGKCLLWDEEGNIINSSEDLKEVLNEIQDIIISSDTLMTTLEEVKDIRNNMVDNIFDISDKITNEELESRLQEIFDSQKKELDNLKVSIKDSIIREVQTDIKEDIKGDILLSQIGELYIQYLPQKQNMLSFIKRDIEYLLCDGREVKREDYPDLADFYGIEEDKEYFNLPIIKGALRAIEVNEEEIVTDIDSNGILNPVQDPNDNYNFKYNIRELGSFQHAAMEQIIGYAFGNTGSSGFGIFDTSAFSGVLRGAYSNRNSYSIPSNVPILKNEGKCTGIDFMVSRVVPTADEFRMDNTAIQMYVKARII